MTDHPSPLRYPGGKTSVAPFLAKTIRLNGLEDGIYAEPFAGGSGAALKLLFWEIVSDIHLNDKDLSIFSFWKSILEEPDEFLRLLRACKVNVRTWSQQKSILREASKCSMLERGFATFFLNRCNHSGVLNGGPIGGLAQKGDYKIDARFNKTALARRIETIQLYRERIKISRLDAIDFLKRQFTDEKVGRQKCLVYLDPPYLAKAQRLYPLYFEHQDHVRLADYLNRSAHFPWIISYDDATPIRKLYAVRRLSVLKKYSLHSARVGRELLISSATCILPRHSSGHDYFGHQAT